MYGLPDRPLNIRPDLDDKKADPNDSNIGPRFLWEYEQEQRKLEESHLDDQEASTGEDSLKEDSTDSGKA